MSTKAAYGIWLREHVRGTVAARGQGRTGDGRRDEMAGCRLVCGEAAGVRPPESVSRYRRRNLP